MGTVDILLGVTLRWTSIPSRGGGVAILPVASCNWNKLQLYVSLARVRLDVYYLNIFVLQYQTSYILGELTKKNKKFSLTGLKSQVHVLWLVGLYHWFCLCVIDGSES